MKTKAPRSRAKFGEKPARRQRRSRATSPPTRRNPAAGEFAHLFAQSLDLLCIAGFDGYFKYLNPAWTTRLGWSVGELKARPFLDFVHPADRDATWAEVGKLAGGADTILFENRYRHENGSFRWLQWNASAAPGRRRIYAMARDITRRKELEREILDIADHERERLGRELHDGLCQTLAGIAALSSTLAKKLAAQPAPAAAAAAVEIHRLLNHSISETRNLARGLISPDLARAGLDAALESLTQNVQHLFRVSCALECERPFPRLRPEAEAHLFRIAQEAIHNAITHGRANRIELSLKPRDGRGCLQVRANGLSISGRAADRDGTGLRTMTYRARLIGGSLDVRRRAPRGTTVTCAFPLPGPSEKPDHVRPKN